MRKSLLLSTALVAVFAATQAFAGDYKNKWDKDEDKGSVNISGEVYQTGATDSVIGVSGNVSVGENSVFSNNKSGTGGAVAVLKDPRGSLTIGANTQFLNNEATYDGGAVGVGRDGHGV